MRYGAQSGTVSARPELDALRLRLAGAAAMLVAASAMGGCSTAESPPENGTQIQDVRLDAIREVVPDADLEYKEVTMPGHVEQVISPSAFSISDPDDPLAGELLMVNKSGKGGMESGAPVKVTGIVYWGFNAADVKQETGIELDEAHTSNGRVTPKSCPPESTPKSNTRVIV